MECEADQTERPGGTLDQIAFLAEAFHSFVTFTVIVALALSVPKTGPLVFLENPSERVSGPTCVFSAGRGNGPITEARAKTHMM